LIESNKLISSEKAVQEFGYKKTGIDDSIKDTLDWFRSQSKLKV